MPTVAVIAAKDLRLRFRDRSALVLGFAAPLVIALLISLAFQSAQSFHAKLGVVDDDHGPLAAAFLDLLHDPQLKDVVTVVTVDSDGAARAQVKDSRVDAALVIPSGFSAAVDGQTVLPISVLANVDRKIAAQVAGALGASFTAQLEADRLSVLTAIDAGAPAARAAELATLASSLSVPVHVVESSVASHQLKVISYYAPGMAIFFLFFAIGVGARSYFTEVREGTLDRIAVAPVSPGSLLLGKALSVFVYGLASLAVMVVVTTAFFGARWGGPVAVAAVCSAMVLAVVALTGFVITLSRTERQAEGLASIMIFGLALLGGNFVFVSASPPLMRRLALLTPNGWALRAFIDLSTGSGRFSDAVVPVIAILAFTGVVATMAALGARRLVTR